MQKNTKNKAMSTTKPNPMSGVLKSRFIFILARAMRGILPLFPQKAQPLTKSKRERPARPHQGFSFWRDGWCAIAAAPDESENVSLTHFRGTIANWEFRAKNESKIRSPTHPSSAPTGFGGAGDPSTTCLRQAAYRSKSKSRPSRSFSASASMARLPTISQLYLPLARS